MLTHLPSPASRLYSQRLENGFLTNKCRLSPQLCLLSFVWKCCSKLNCRRTVSSFKNLHLKKPVLVAGTRDASFVPWDTEDHHQTSAGSKWQSPCQEPEWPVCSCLIGKRKYGNHTKRMEMQTSELEELVRVWVWRNVKLGLPCDFTDC